MDFISSYLTTVPLHTTQLLGAFAAYQFLYSLAAPAISLAVANKTYLKLPLRTKTNWDIRVVSTLQAIFICYCAFDVIRNNPERRNTTKEQRLWAYSPSSGRVQAFAAGYFLWDVIVSAQHVEILGVSSLIHAVCAFGITMLGFRPFANFYGINFVLYALSTPFLNVHWYLDKLGMTGSWLQLVNGICLMSVFAGCRLVWGSLQTWKLSQDIYSAWGSEWVHYSCDAAEIVNSSRNALWGRTEPLCGPQKFPTTLVLIYLISNSLLTILNFYWFGKMVKALRKRLE